MSTTCVNISNIVPNGTLYNNRPVYDITLTGDLSIYSPAQIKYNQGRWEFYATNSQGNLVFASATEDTYAGCPKELEFSVFTGQDASLGGTIKPFLLVECGFCDIKEERIFAEYQAVSLPNVPPVIEHEEPFKCCDERLLVLAHPTETESYKNDITSAWIKLSSVNDTYEFVLTKDNVATNYTVSPQLFVNEPDAYYVTIPWQSVLNSDGEGCYKLEVNYSIGGLAGSITWGIYQLKTYSLKTANKTARLKSIFNLKQEIEGIDFTNSNVVDTIRFFGFIGERQPNMEIDNLIYSDRVVKSVVRENLNTYKISTDPYTDTLINYLTDLHLLSENDLFISDYNTFNHSHSILDIPVIVQESPEIDYLEKYQRKAVLTCIVGDKSKNKRTHY